MSGQLFNLPINIPWRQIAVSPDMMDTEFCNELFPFAWRSSMAISVFEPDPADLPEELCGDRITYLKITTTITGYQPTEDETKWLEELERQLRITFPNIPVEDLQNAIDRIINQYFACYGTLLNVAVFPYPNTKKELVERVRIVFGQLQIPGLEDIQPDTDLPNPFEHPSGVELKATDQPNNRLVDIFPGSGDGVPELDLHTQMVITIPQTQGLAAIEAKVAYANNVGVVVEAFSTGESVGTVKSEGEPGQEHTLVIEADDIDTVVITSLENQAALLEFAYYIGRDVPIELNEYPHVIDFEPKLRDLYQAATESGEILSGSKSGVMTNKSLTHTESTESTIKFGATAEAVIPSTPPIKVGGSLDASRTNKETDQDQWTVQTDASRERRETQGTTTQISQMYNLLTGYHAGTNRAVFLMLARPHVLQPTDFRTFVQGLRAIEGMQEFFLIVSRPEGIEGLCVEASLETGHFPEDTAIVEPEEQYIEDHLDYVVTAKAEGAGLFGSFNPFDDPECVHIEEDPSATQSVPLGWVVDKRTKRMRQSGGIGSGWDPGHPGVAHLNTGNSPLPGNVNYQATEETLKVSGKICGDSDYFSSGEDNNFNETFRVFIRSEQPVLTHQQPFADIGRLLVTNRGLCACFKSGDCIEVFPSPVEPKPYVESIVDEPIIAINRALLTRDASRRTRLPAMKEFLQKIHSALTTSFRRPSRNAIGQVGFLESDYFKDQIKALFPESYLQQPLGKVEGLSEKVVNSLGAEMTIDQALNMDLARFARRTGLSVSEAAKNRHKLLGLQTRPDEDHYRPPVQSID